MKFYAYIIPALLILLFLYSFITKKSAYDYFIKGVQETIPLVISLFPYILAILLLSELFEISGLSDFFIKAVSPIFTFLGIPKELIKLIIIKPFSGSGSLALLDEIYKSYGTSGYIPLVASAIFGSSETVFYVTAIYYTKCKNKNATKAIIISLIASFITTCVACLLCKLFI